GVFAILDYFDKKKKERSREADELDEKIISRMKLDIEQQNRTIDDLRKEVKRVLDENTKLVAENKTLTKILQGRDDQSESLRLEAYKAIKQIETIHDSIVTITSQMASSNTNITNMNKNIESLIKKMPNLATN